MARIRSFALMDRTRRLVASRDVNGEHRERHATRRILVCPDEVLLIIAPSPNPIWPAATEFGAKRGVASAQAQPPSPDHFDLWVTL
jgi:hypothetical protein